MVLEKSSYTVGLYHTPSGIVLCVQMLHPRLNTHELLSLGNYGKRAWTERERFSQARQHNSRYTNILYDLCVLKFSLPLLKFLSTV